MLLFQIPPDHGRGSVHCLAQFRPDKFLDALVVVVHEDEVIGVVGRIIVVYLGERQGTIQRGWDKGIARCGLGAVDRRVHERKGAFLDRISFIFEGRIEWALYAS